MLGITLTKFGAEDGDLNAAADLLVFTPSKPIDLVRFGFIIDGATASGTTLVLSLDKRVKAGTDTDRVELDTLSPAATVAQGKGAYKDLATREEIDPGEEVIVEVKTAAGVAATGRVFIEYVERAFQSPPNDRTANFTEIA